MLKNPSVRRWVIVLAAAGLTWAWVAPARAAKDTSKKYYSEKIKEVEAQIADIQPQYDQVVAAAQSFKRELDEANKTADAAREFQSNARTALAKDSSDLRLLEKKLTDEAEKTHELSRLRDEANQTRIAADRERKRVLDAVVASSAHQTLVAQLARAEQEAGGAEIAPDEDSPVAVALKQARQIKDQLRQAEQDALAGDTDYTAATAAADQAKQSFDNASQLVRDEVETNTQRLEAVERVEVNKQKIQDAGVELKLALEKARGIQPKFSGLADQAGSIGVQIDRLNAQIEKYKKYSSSSKKK